MTRRKSLRELEREAAAINDAIRVIEGGDVFSSLMPGSTDYEVVAKAVPAALAYRVAGWSPEDRAALSRVLSYSKGFAANRGPSPAHPRLVPSGDSRYGYVYHSLSSRTVSDPQVAVFSSYDLARAAVAVAEQVALDLGVVVPGRDGSERKRGASRGA